MAHPHTCRASWMKWGRFQIDTHPHIYYNGSKVIKCFTDQHCWCRTDILGICTRGTTWLGRDFIYPSFTTLCFQFIPLFHPHQQGIPSEQNFRVQRRVWSFRSWLGNPGRGLFSYGGRVDINICEHVLLFLESPFALLPQRVYSVLTLSFAI